MLIGSVCVRVRARMCSGDNAFCNGGRTIVLIKKSMNVCRRKHPNEVQRQFTDSHEINNASERYIFYAIACRGLASRPPIGNCVMNQIITTLWTLAEGNVMPNMIVTYAADVTEFPRNFPLCSNLTPSPSIHVRRASWWHLYVTALCWCAGTLVHNHWRSCQFIVRHSSVTCTRD